MIDKLIKTFIKNSEDINNSKVRESYGFFSGCIGIFINIFLAMGKIILGLISGSISILADGMNNISDIGSSLVTLIGFKLSGIPADKEHPYGHARIEYISGLIVSFLIMILGFNLAVESIGKILEPETLVINSAVVLMLVVAVIMKVFLYHLYYKIAKRISSVALMATAKDSINDVISTSGVLLSLAINHFFKINLDGAMGLVIAAMIVISGVGILKDILNPLLGESASEELIDTIDKKLNSYDGVIEYHDLLVHSYGPNKCFATVYIEVDASVDIMKSHAIIEGIEKDFDEELGINLVIHLEPVIINDQSDLVRDDLLRILKELPIECQLSSLRVTEALTHFNIVMIVEVLERHHNKHSFIIEKISEELKNINSKYYSSIEIEYLSDFK